MLRWFCRVSKRELYLLRIRIRMLNASRIKRLRNSEILVFCAILILVGLLFFGILSNALYSWLSGLVLVILCVQLYRHSSFKVKKITTEDEYDTFESLDKAIKEKPETADYYYRRGTLHHDMCQYDEAFEDLNKAIELDGTLSRAWMERACVLMDDSEYEKALNDLNTAIELGFGIDMIGDTDMDLQTAYYNRGLAKIKCAQYHSAIDDFNEMIKLSGSWSTMEKEGLAESYYKLGLYDKAISEYSDAIRYNKVISTILDNSRYYNHRGICYFEAGDKKKARKDWKRASSKGYDLADELLKEHFSQ